MGFKVTNNLKISLNYQDMMTAITANIARKDPKCQKLTLPSLSKSLTPSKRKANAFSLRTSQQSCCKSTEAFSGGFVLWFSRMFQENRIGRERKNGWTDRQLESENNN